MNYTTQGRHNDDDDDDDDNGDDNDDDIDDDDDNDTILSKRHAHVAGNTVQGSARGGARHRSGTYINT